MANAHPLSVDGEAAFSRGRGLGVLLIGLATFATATAFGQEIERDPINYSAATPRNAVAGLWERLAAGKVTLEYEPEHGYLRSLLRALDVPESSQVLVFSKTSMQRSGSFRTDHASPLAERWGGWYVTGTSGRQKHLGNMISQGSKRPEEIDNADGVNVVDLKNRFTTSSYLTPHSDIVALMVLEHQTGMLNRLARAGLETRMALHYEREINKALDRPADEQSDTARYRIRSAGDEKEDLA